MPTLDDAEKRLLRARCTRWLSFGPPRTGAAWLAELAASPHLELALDAYSAGPAIGQLERRVAGLLGKEAALWFPKGIVAQQAALLVHAAARGSDVVALHPRSHLALDEGDAVQRLAGLTVATAGQDIRPFGVEHLDALAEPLAAVVVETPLRRAGYQASSWEQLGEISSWARAHGAALHLDGARLWETQPWYGRSLSEIAALADSVYVSLYKGLGGMAGCVLAGSRRFIDATRPWRLRYGGDLPLAFPLIVSALDGLDRTLPRMGDYYRHACGLAAAIDSTPGLRVFPHPPHCNSFQVHFTASADALDNAATEIAREEGTWLFGRFQQGLLPDSAFGEVVVTEASLGWAPQEAARALGRLAARAADRATAATNCG